jgi:mRNA interferase HicA
VKRRDLEKIIQRLGWKFERHGRKHDIWSNGENEIAIPRHKEINEYTAKEILKEAKGGK